MKKVLFTLLAVMLLAKNVYSTEVSKNFYMLLQLYIVIMEKNFNRKSR